MVGRLALIGNTGRGSLEYRQDKNYMYGSQYASN